MAEYTKATIRQALLDHGHQYLTRPVVDRMAQDAVEELVLEHTWGWRRRELVAALPVEIPDLGTVEQVVGPGGPVEPSARDKIRDLFGNAASGGVASRYYRDGKTIGGYPVDGTEFTISYFSTWCWVSADGDTRKQSADAEDDKLVIWPEHQGLVFMLMRVAAKAEAGDNDQAAAIRQNEYETRLEEIRSDRDQVDELVRVRVTNPDWA